MIIDKNQKHLSKSCQGCRHFLGFVYPESYPKNPYCQCHLLNDSFKNEDAYNKRADCCPLVDVGWTRTREEIIAKIDEYLKLPIEKQLEPRNLGFYDALRWVVDKEEK